MNTNQYEITGIHIDSRDFHIVESTSKGVKIKGIAVPAGITSRNNRHYTAIALAAGAHTFNGKPLTINHNNNNIAGNIDEMTYNEDQDIMEYVAWIKKEPYATMARTHDQKLRGVSIDADYLFSRCRDCSRKFYTAESYKNHMYSAHLKSVSVDEPHGLKGKALSLVIAPEEPGVPQNTLEIAEMVKRKDDLMFLIETIINEKKEEEKMQSNTTAGIGTGPPYTVKEQADTPQEKEKEKEKKKDEEEEAEEAAASETTKIKPLLTEAAPKLKLGEPFAGYDDFAACVAANSDKENPEAYCGTIKKQAEETLHFQKSVVGKVNEIVEAFNGLKFPADDLGWKQQILAVQESIKTEVQRLTESINAVPKDDVSWKDIKPYDDTALKEAIAKIPVADIGTAIEMLKKTVGIVNDTTEKEYKEVKEAIANLKPYDDTALKTTLETLNKTLTENHTQTTEKQALIETKLATYESEAKTLKEALEKQVQESLRTKETFEKLLEKADANNLEIKKSLEERTRELTETKQSLALKIEETAKQAAEAKTIAENVDDKLKPTFKGNAKTIVKETTPATSFNPYDPNRKP